MNNGDHEFPDHHQYRPILFDTDSVRFFISALDFHIKLAEDERAKVKEDPYLREFLAEDASINSGIDENLHNSKSLKEWLEAGLERTRDTSHITLSPSHREVRYLKSVGLLYLGAIKLRRNHLASQPNISMSTLAAIDREITKKEEILSSGGVFSKASPLPLLVEQQVVFPDPEEIPAGGAQSIVKAERPAPVVVDSIELLDQQLRDRCLDIFQQFRSSGQPNRYDTVIRDATSVLEDRLRRVLGCGEGMTGKELATAAFSGEKPRLQISSIKPEQQAVHQLFLGTFGFIRNPVQHRLIESFSAERALQILGWIDYLLAIINSSEQMVDENANSSKRDGE